jgi:hypothetical protein
MRTRSLPASAFRFLLLVSPALADPCRDHSEHTGL